MSNVDIVARLQLRAEQFSSETGQAFGAMETRAASAATQVRTSFNGAFAEVQKLANTSLTLPRTTSGSLDLSAEIAQLNQSALAADQHAQALRELSIAQTAAAHSGQVDAQAMKLEADASAVAVLAHERDAQSSRERAAALQLVQTELNRTTSATVVTTAAGGRYIASAGQQRAATIQLGQQVQDFAVQVSSGQSIITAFSQQIGQATYAVQQMGGKMAGVAAFLNTPWGAALTVAAVVAAPLIANILAQNNALDDAVDKLKKDAVETEVTSRAKAIFAHSEEGVAAAIRESTEALKKSIEGERSAAERTNIRTRAIHDEEIAIRRRTLARLEEAEKAANILAGPGISSERGIGVAQSAAQRRVAELQAAAEVQRKGILAAEKNYQNSRIDLAGEVADRRLDPIKQINYEYKEAERLLRAKTRATIADGKTVDAVYTNEVAKLRERRDAAIEAEQKRQQEMKRSVTVANELGRSITLAEGRDIVAGIGGRVTSDQRTRAEQEVLYARYKTGTGALAAKPGTSYHELGQALDIAKTQGMTLAKIRDAFKARGVRLTELLDEGSHFHAAWKQSAADTKAANDVARDAAAAQRELEGDLASVIQQLDPVRAAAERYAETLSKIDKLRDAGKIDFGQAFDLTLRANEAERERKAAEFNQNAKSVLGITSDPLAGILAGADREGRAALVMTQEEIEIARGQVREISDTFYTLFSDGVDKVWENFKRRGLSIISDLAAEQVFGAIFGGNDSAAKRREASGDGSEVVVKELRAQTAAIRGAPKTTADRLGKTILEGVGYGQIGGAAFSAITGKKQDSTASAIGGVLGGVAGEAVGKAISKGATGLLKSLGGAAGPIGSIVGGVLGSVVGGLFQKAPKGSAGITVDQTGAIKAGTASGTTGDARAGAATLAGAVASGLQQIADLLGAKVTGTTDVQIGSYKGEIRVNDHGAAIGGVKGSGALSFTSEADAVAYAIADALKDGVLSGISAASLKILQSGQDLQKAIGKALLIESIPKELKARLDPVGAAIDEVNRKYQKLVDALKEGGGSAQQMADAQQLYNLELADAKTNAQAAASTLKDFLNGLKLGGNSPLALREQEATAKAALQPYLDKIGRGETIDQGKYQSAAQSFLDVERQLYGSTGGYFAEFEKIQAATARAIEKIDNAVPIAPGVADPFASQTASSTAATARAAQTGNEMMEDNNALLQRIAELMKQLALNGGGGGTFIGSNRNFVEAA